MIVSHTHTHTPFSSDDVPLFFFFDTGATACAANTAVAHSHQCVVTAAGGYTCSSPGVCTNGAWADAAATCTANPCDKAALNLPNGGDSAHISAQTASGSAPVVINSCAGASSPSGGVWQAQCTAGAWQVTPNGFTCTNDCGLPSSLTGVASWTGDSSCSTTSVSSGVACSITPLAGYTCTRYVCRHKTQFMIVMTTTTYIIILITRRHVCVVE
jgi:hypothetical protein